MGKSTLLLGYGIALADTILAPFIPSPTARSGGIIYPIANDLALDYGSKPNDPTSRRVGSYLMWVAIMTTCVTSSLFLTAASFNLLAAGFVEKLAHIDLRWTDWFITAAPAIIPLLVLVPVLTYWLYPPEVKKNPEVSQWAATQLQKIGPLSRNEMILAAVVVLSLVLWVAGGTYVGAATVAGIAVCQPGLGLASLAVMVISLNAVLQLLIVASFSTATLVGSLSTAVVITKL